MARRSQSIFRRDIVLTAIRDSFPKLDMIKTARIIQEWRRPR